MATLHSNDKISKLTDFRDLWLKRLVSRDVLRKNKKKWGMPHLTPILAPKLAQSGYNALQWQIFEVNGFSRSMAQKTRLKGYFKEK